MKVLLIGDVSGLLNWTGSAEPVNLLAGSLVLSSLVLVGTVDDEPPTEPPV